MRELCERSGIVLQDRKMKSRVVVESFLKTTQFKYREKDQASVTSSRNRPHESEKSQE